MISNKKTNLNLYKHNRNLPGRNKIIVLLWYFTNVLFFINPLNPFSKIKIVILRIFGANVGKSCLIKPSVNIKFPWKLTIGNNVWVGENVWIDNLVNVTIGDNCCISQGAMLLTGSHDYTKVTFDMIVGEIILEDGVWLGAKSIVYPNVKCKSHSILGANSVAVKDLESYIIYHGNPAVKITKREIK